MTTFSRGLAGFALLLGLLLGGCQTPRAAEQAANRLTEAQVAMLKAQGFVQGDGGWEFGFADKLLFPLDQSKLDAAQGQVIDRIARALLSVGITHARVDGHTDATGRAAYNAKLSQERAEVVANVMIAAGLSPTGVEVHGLGARYPVASNRTLAGRQENRRVVIVIGE